jgi:hypothetical protein
MARTSKAAEVWGAHLSRASEKKRDEKKATAKAKTTSAFRLSSSLRGSADLAPKRWSKRPSDSPKASLPTEKENVATVAPNVEDAPVSSSPADVQVTDADETLLNATKLKVDDAAPTASGNQFRTFRIGAQEEKRDLLYASHFDSDLVSKLACEDSGAVVSTLSASGLPSDHSSAMEEDNLGDLDDEDYSGAFVTLIDN